LYASSNVTTVIKSGRMRWTGNVAHMGKARNAYILVGKPGANYLEDLGVDEKIILEWILGK
jgi:hypothetical protein